MQAPWPHSTLGTLGLVLALVGCGSSVSSSGAGGGGQGPGGQGPGGGGSGGVGTTSVGGMGGEAGMGGTGGTGGWVSVSDACNDVCSDPLANPTDGCGECLGLSLSESCGAPFTACLQDPTLGDCMSCGEYHEACNDGCPDPLVLCGPSRDLLDELNACLCGTCSETGAPVTMPGFMECERPEPPQTACTGLDHASCVTTPGCHAIDGDPCPGAMSCGATPKFSVCVATAAAAVPGDCATLAEAGCGTRDDCTSIRLPGGELCCAARPSEQPFVECVDERQPPTLLPNCVTFTDLGDCLAESGCRPGMVLMSGVLNCGPFLETPEENEGWIADWTGVCLPEW